MDAEVRRYIEAHFNEAVKDLERICNQPSVSAQGLGIAECADLVKRMLEETGISAHLLAAPGGPPAVFGEIRGASARTLLVYDHFDVQPPEPLELWQTPPFNLSVRDGCAYARGVSDDKGNLVARLHAIRAWLKVKGRLPCSLQYIVEGEEEIGSPHMGAFMGQHRSLFKADFCIWEGGGVNSQGRPQIILGCKGIVYLELEAKGTGHDAHSSYGAVVPNAAWRLAWALRTIKGPDERVRIRGFYDRVRRPTRVELAALRRLPDETEADLRGWGLKGFLKDVRGYTYRKRHLLEPSCSICGIEGGYTGKGTKTVIPAAARAKIDFRLVPDQRPEEVVEGLKAHLAEHGFGDIQVRDPGGHSPPARTPITSPWVKVVGETAKEVYSGPPEVSPTAAGSGPMAYFRQLGLDVIMGVGAGYPESRIHSPNENIRLDDFRRAVLHTAALLERVGRG
ncbi:MAG: M20/M25/M40 family metallo-hydrolase [Chloroflexi bacterium]|nr:M20/M25/M40 family metallo-hydrolase [Chloroflexota bacterium]